MGDVVEVVDPYWPAAIRLAVVVDINPWSFLRLRFVGWESATFDFWIESDSLDLFEPGLCALAEFELTPPPDCKQHSTECSLKVCLGVGNANGYPLATHQKLSECPYEAALGDYRRLPDRLTGAQVASMPTRAVSSRQSSQRSSSSQSYERKQRGSSAEQHSEFGVKNRIIFFKEWCEIETQKSESENRLAPSRRRRHESECRV